MIIHSIWHRLELVSAGDLELERKGYIDKADIKKENVIALVDSGAYMMCINEDIKVQLDLPVMDIMEAELADGSLQTMEVVGPLLLISKIEPLALMLRCFLVNLRFYYAQFLWKIWMLS